MLGFTDYSHPLRTIALYSRTEMRKKGSGCRSAQRHRGRESDDRDRQTGDCQMGELIRLFVIDVITRMRQIERLGGRGREAETRLSTDRWYLSVLFPALIFLIRRQLTEVQDTCRSSPRTLPAGLARDSRRCLRILFTLVSQVDRLSVIH